MGTSILQRGRLAPSEAKKESETFWALPKVVPAAIGLTRREKQPAPEAFHTRNK